jgi:hypothetical protein
MRKADKEWHWYQTFQGERFNPLLAEPSDIQIEDIAHALSQICRYGGHCRKFYSVAQHSVIVAAHLAPPFQFEGLMHDSPEAYIGDMVKPLKIQMPEFNRVENHVWRVIAKRFHLPNTMSPKVKKADAQALGTERRDLLDNRFHYHWKFLEGVKIWKKTVVPWSSPKAEREFLKWFHYLYPIHMASLKK